MDTLRQLTAMPQLPGCKQVMVVSETPESNGGMWLAAKRRLLSACAHAVLFAFSLLLSFALAYNFHLEPPWFTEMYLPMLPFVVAMKLLVFGLWGEYDTWWRYVSLRDLLRIVGASYVSVLMFIFGYFGAEWTYALLSEGGILFPEFRQSVFLLDCASTIAVVGEPAKRTRLLIIGAGNAGETLLREILRMPEGRYEVVGFLDDDPRKQGVRIHGVRVLGTCEQIKEICEEYEVEEILIAIPSATRKQLRRVISLCEGTNLRFRTVPGIDELIDGKVTVSQIREVRIEDLLGREPVQLDLELVAKYLQDKVVLVTGAGGSIGSEMCRQVARFSPKRLVLVEQAENPLFEIERELRQKFPDLDIAPYIADICDAKRIRRIFKTERPAVVFHAAAHKHVPIMEAHPGEAVKNNILGTKTVADAAAEAGVEKFVMISTDKAVNPTSVMGCTKRVAEMYIQELSHRSKTQFVTVRFGNVLGSSGSVVPIFKEQIAKGGPVTVTHPEMCRYFMTIPEASQLVLQAGAMGEGGEIFVLDMGEPVKIVDLARTMIVLSGLRPGEDIEIVFTGVRPGEKLYEELLIAGEDVLPTRHEKIGIWKQRREDWDRICRGIAELAAMVDEASADEIRAKLAEIVPEYDPNRWKQYSAEAASRSESDLRASSTVPSTPS